MTYPVTKLIGKAFYAASIVSRQFQTVDGEQEAVGLELLNEILSDSTIEKELIPHFQVQYPFNAVSGQEKYFIPNLVDASTIVFFINSVRFEVSPVPRDQYFGTSRAENVSSLPFIWHFERTVGGAYIYLYFLPNQSYSMQLNGKFALSEVSIGQDLQSPISTANLGIAYVGGTGLLAPGAFVINGVDLAGTYATSNALVNYINTGIIPNVRVSVADQGQFVLTSTAQTAINITTLGVSGPTNYLTFTNFNTLDGSKNQSFLPMVLDRFYINYLKYRLAKRICDEYNYEVPNGVSDELSQYKDKISARSAPLDLTMNTVCSINTENGALTYAQVNIGRGWTRPY